MTKSHLMRVAMVLPHSPEPFFPGYFANGGTVEGFHEEFFPAHDSYYNNLAHALRQFGVQVEIYYLAQYGKRLSSYRHKLGHTLKRIPSIGRDGKWGWEYSPWLHLELWRDRPDLVHILGYNMNLRIPDLVDCLALSTKALGRPYIVHHLGSSLDGIGGLRLLIKRWTLRHAAWVLTSNHRERNRLIDSSSLDSYGLNLLPERVTFVENIVDLGRFQETDRQASCQRLGLDPSKRYLVSVGRLTSLKGFQVVIGTLPSLPEDVHYVIVGDGPEHRQLIDLAENLGVVDRTHLVGWVQSEMLPEFYGLADVYVLSSLCEGLPIVILEALACGRPVVASRVGGVPDVIASEGVGLIYDPGNQLALRECVLRVLDGSWKPDTAQVRQVVEGFGPEAVGKKLVAIYRAILAEGTGRGKGE